MELTHKSYLKLALPFILVSATTPLLGAVIFSTMYWLFNFLRLITSGLSSQALGRGARDETALSLLRPGLLSLAAGLLMIAAQTPIAGAALWILNPGPEVRDLVLLYFHILIWGAPLVLMGFVMIGWLMGQMRLRAVMILQVSTNLSNAVLSFFS